MDALKEVLTGRPGSFVYPFFWQQGVEPEILMRELEQIRGSGARAVCLEARPHPDFLGPRWWADLDRIMTYARAHDMKVWLLDDDHFPTGHAAGAFATGKHPLANRFLTVHVTDVLGPLPGGYMPVTTFLPEDAQLIGVSACKRRSEQTTDLDAGSHRDVTRLVEDGWLRMDVPEGLWRILIFYTTSQGNGKRDYFNILDSASVRLLLDRVYEPHYARYKADFGETFQGFFSDEPEFGNLPGYEFRARLGKDMPFLPWSGELEERLRRRWGDSFGAYLPALWFAYDDLTDAVRYMYMDEVTKQLAVSFSGQIGAWCRRRGVLHVGHIIEDDNAHGRLGCSTGHYFRSLSSMGMAGVDVVHLEILPGMCQEVRQWMASDRDGEFFHFGLAKLGSSLAHIDPKKQGNTLCELFGAYGWQEGIGLMKWLTDHMIARGVNYFVPHAYSSRPYPDPDCPPHFYAGGHHPQFAFFGELTRYMNRVSHLFSGGGYPARAAVLYHADAEWAGEAMTFQKPLRQLMEGQIDADVVPADLFAGLCPGVTAGAAREEKSCGYEVSFDGELHAAKQTYQALVIPGCRYIPEPVARFLPLALESGFPVLFVGRRPEGVCGRMEPDAGTREWRKAWERMPLAPLEETASWVRSRIKPRISLGKYWPQLRVWPYRKGEREYIFLFNEAVEDAVADVLSVEGENRAAWLYDAKTNRLYGQTAGYGRGRLEIPVALEPGESVILVLGEKPEGIRAGEKVLPGREICLEKAWRIEAREVMTGDCVFGGMAEAGRELPDLSREVLRRRFCGTLAYTTVLRVDAPGERRGLIRIEEPQDCVRVLLDGRQEAMLYGAPLTGEIRLSPGEHRLTLELPLTPAWENGDPWNALTMIPGAGLKKKPRVFFADESGERGGRTT